MTANVKATEAVALWQNPPKLSHAALHVMAWSPLYAKYITSVDTAPAPMIMYVNTCIHSHSFIVKGALRVHNIFWGLNH